MSAIKKARSAQGKAGGAPRIDPTLPLALQPAYMSVPDAATYLRRSTRTLRAWEAKGLLRCVRPAGGDPLVPRAELERLLVEGSC